VYQGQPIPRRSWKQQTQAKLLAFAYPAGTFEIFVAIENYGKNSVTGGFVNLDSAISFVPGVVIDPFGTISAPHPEQKCLKD
jgi:hypothetical protein